MWSPSKIKLSSNHGCNRSLDRGPAPAGFQSQQPSPYRGPGPKHATPKPRRQGFPHTGQGSQLLSPKTKRRVVGRMVANSQNSRRAGPRRPTTRTLGRRSSEGLDLRSGQSQDNVAPRANTQNSGFEQFSRPPTQLSQVHQFAGPPKRSPPPKANLPSTSSAQS